MAGPNEFVITGLDESTGELTFGERENEGVDEVTEILSGSKENSESNLEESDSETGSNESSPETNKEIVAGFDPSSLEARLNASNEQIRILTQKLNDRENKETVQGNKEKEEAFNKEIKAELDDALEFMEPEKREKLLNLLTKIVTKNAGDSIKTLEEKQKEKEDAENQSRQELSAVVGHYDGKDGRPELKQMEPLIKFLDSQFGTSEILKFPIHAVFRAAENVPFMIWLSKEHPDKIRGMNFPQLVLASEKVREFYYKDPNHKPYSHLDFLFHGGTATPSTNNNNNNEEDIEQVAENLSEDRGVGISATGNNTLVKPKPTPAKTTRDVIFRTLRELNVR